MLKISPDQATAAYAILVEEAGAGDDPDELYSFVFHVSKSRNPAEEFRFSGRLGAGGKFRNNGNRDIPYIDCYPEHLTPERFEIIKKVNRKFEAIFSPSPGQLQGP